MQKNSVVFVKNLALKILNIYESLLIIVLSMSVCLSVCLSASVARKLCGQISPNFLCMLPVPMARSFSDGIAIRYVLPVLRMTSCFHTKGTMGGPARRCVVRWVAVLIGAAAGRMRDAAAHWLASSAGRLAWARLPGRALAVRRLDSAAAGTVVRVSPCASR